MKTYVDKKAYAFSMPWKLGMSKRFQLDIADIRELISEVIEDCAKEANNPERDWFGQGPSARIRALNTKLLP